MQLFDPFYYEKAHLLIILVFSFYYYLLIRRKDAQRIINRSRGGQLVYIYALVFIVVVGLRPISPAFGDTVNYANIYESYSQIAEQITSSRDSLFYISMWFCSHHMNITTFFLIVEFLYTVPLFWGCIRLLKKNADIGMLFCFAAFSFFTYGVNGLRNGVALSLVFLAITFIQGNSFEKVFCSLLSVLAIAFHASAALPVVCMIGSSIIKNHKLMFYFWGLSIVISLIAGNAVANLFASIGFDDRLSDYIHADNQGGRYTVTTFRWDFLLYSTMPILLGWYVIFKKRVINSTYRLLLGTYIFANAFWIMVIRAEFYNRFAYLSWFLYPIVLAYPLLKLKIWPKTQGQKTAIIMMAHLAFTLFMVFVL